MSTQSWREKVWGTEPPEHGSGGYSNYGCRCDVCTNGHTKRANKYNKRKREQR